MSIRDKVGVYDAAEFADNPEPRCPIVLLLDSGIPTVVPPEDINRALAKFRDVIQEDVVAALRADIAVIEFGRQARVVQDFTNGADFEFPELAITRNGSHYARAINMALDVIEARKRSYQDNGIAHYRALVYFLTNWWGARESIYVSSMTDQFGFMYEGFDIADCLKGFTSFLTFGNTELADAAARLSAKEQNREVAFFSFITDIGVNGFAGHRGYAEYIERVAGLAGVSEEELCRTAEITIEQLERGTRGIAVHNAGGYKKVGTLLISTETAAALAGISEPEFMEWGVREGIIWTPQAGLSKLSPPHRPAMLLANMEQMEGSIEWLSRSVAAVSQSQPGDSIRLPAQDFLQR